MFLLGSQGPGDLLESESDHRRTLMAPTGKEWAIGENDVDNRTLDNRGPEELESLCRSVTLSLCRQFRILWVLD